MRPYLVLYAVLLIAVAAFGQQPVPPRIYGPCILGCGSFVPLITTPMVSLQQVSPNPVGASNATTGLSAGATNSTLSQVSGNTSSVYTEPVWYQGGGAPVTTSAVHLWPEPAGHSMHGMHEMREMHEGKGDREEAKASWIYYSGTEYIPNPTQGASSAKSGKKAARTYTNDDVQRQNQNNGNVKYNGKAEKL
jgi:hypothetical protein